MSVILRHMKFPLVIIFKDPKKNWDKIVKECLLEDIKENDFGSFTTIDEKTAKVFLECMSAKKVTKKKEKNDESR